METAMDQKYIPLLIGLLIGGIIAGGCTSPATPAAGTTPSLTTEPASSITTGPVPAGEPSAPPATATAGTTVPPATTTIPATSAVPTIATPAFQETKAAVASDPYVEKFTLTKEDYGISDCIMSQAFPEITRDPDYGISSARPKLVGIPDEKFAIFYDVYTSGKSSGFYIISFTRCQEIPESEATTWDFAHIEAKLIPRNAKTSDYSIIITLSANGKDISQLIQNETLTLERRVIIDTWVPIKRTQIDRLGNPSINFNRLTNL